ncbi:hypothetical protein MA16_Dca005721 [Dendrobium catenatum]|uniref:Uncharacterized protein n=1 Tax=Dendrobium catenatum TaxID=906689 RepID=A0A2I0WQF5_9ASPA|nr:hypothetical protein MA16_Dca005721 [Dendrobium catenatum]
MKSAFAGPTSISPAQNFEQSSTNPNGNLPVVTRFFCPPEMPLIIASPTMVSAQTSSPKILR